MSDFDYIIAGAGAAGLSLACHLAQSELAERRILLIDPDPKERNDRTWCFWEAGMGVFEEVVFRSWERLWFHGSDYSARLLINPYRYKMIQGGDFYRFARQRLEELPQLTRLSAAVERIEERPDGVSITAGGQLYHGRWAFNSIYHPEPRRPGYSYWLQHFKGWVITAAEPIFDPDAATFMDFRVEQGDDVRFVYVLPFDTHTALVEYTLFSPALVAQEFYEAGLRHYIRELLELERYTIEHVEFGVIPMTDSPFARRPSRHVINIGTAGGMTKASTGYTFQRIQKQSRKIVASLLADEQPFYPEPPLNRHALMDSVLLKVLDSKRESGRRFFEQLFGRNSPQRVLRFLDEETTLAEDLALMTTVNIPAFAAATLDVAGWRTRNNLAALVQQADRKSLNR